MFCTACGTRNAEISNYCKQCGHKLDRTGAAKISEEAFDRALPLEEQVSALLERAYRLRKAGELSSAVRLCEEALQLNPESTSVHSLLGQIQEQAGNHDAAIHEYERVLQLNPGSIADRVKLDELRGGGLPTPVHPRTAPHIVMPNRSVPNPNGRQMLGIAAVAGTLMVMGGLIALQFFSHQDRGGTPVAYSNPHPDSRFANKSPQAGAPVGGSASTGTPSTAGAQIASNPTPPSSGNGAPAGSPSNVPNAGQVNYRPPAIIVNPQPIYIHDGQPASASARNAGALPNMPGPRSQAANDDDDPPRVHLSGDEKPYNIVIRGDGDSGDTTASGKGGTTKPPKSPGIATGPKNPPDKLIVHPPATENNSAGGISIPTTEAQSLIAIAGDKFNNADYDTAIKDYHRALSGAGSQTGYVFQQMGYCYQRIKDKQNAITNFNNAIAEYKKLESANQQVDLAKAGIKVCENGIKLCNTE